MFISSEGVYAFRNKCDHFKLTKICLKYLDSFIQCILNASNVMLTKYKLDPSPIGSYSLMRDRY